MTDIRILHSEHDVCPITPSFVGDIDYCKCRDCKFSMDFSKSHVVCAFYTRKAVRAP